MSSTKSLEREVIRLRAAHESVAAELNVCQADKEFVWSLWKQLQVSNPDLTQTIGLVVQREKEKTELKDRKVLEILQHKDECLSQLERTTASQTQELSALIAQKVQLERKVDHLEAENTKLLEEKAKVHEQLHEQLQCAEQRDADSASREAVRQLDKENLELKQVIYKRDVEVESMKRYQDDLKALHQSQLKQIKDLEGDVKDVGSQSERLVHQHNEAKELLKKYERETRALKAELKQKTDEVDAVWKTHTQTVDASDEQSALIHQLHNINKDTQQMMKNQAETHAIESSALKTKYDILVGKNQELKREVLEYKQLLEDQQRSPDDLDSEQDAVMTSRPSHRVAGGHGERAVSPEKMDSVHSRLEDAYTLLHTKNRELEEMKRAHDKRLGRVKSLAHSHKLVKEQLKLTEELFAGKKNLRRRRRVGGWSAKSLQREDSDQVWNKLYTLETEHARLHTENVNLHEEVDQLRVKVVHDTATILELRTCLEHEKQELQELMLCEEEKDRQHTEQMEERRLAAVTALLHKTDSDRTRLLQEISDLKDQIQKYEDREREHETSRNELRRKVVRLQREVRRKSRPVTLRSRQVASLRSVGGGDVVEQWTDDAWQDIPPQHSACGDFTSEDDGGLTADSTQSLGALIAHQAQQSPTSTASPLRHSTPTHVPMHSPLRQTPTVQEEKVKFDVKPADKRDPHVVTRDTASSPLTLTPLHSDLDLVPSRQRPCHDRATSPIRSQPVVARKTNPVVGSSRQVAALKQRVRSLHDQVALLRKVKQNLTETNREHVQRTELLQAELTSANQRLQTQKMTAQRLGTEVERLRSERSSEDKDDASSSVSRGDHSEQEWRSLQGRCKAAVNEASKQLTTIKQLREENGAQSEKIKKLQDRLNHVERDVGQKRALVEELKAKNKSCEEHARGDVDLMLEVEAKINSLSLANGRYKTQLDSLKQRLNVATKAKNQSEMNIQRVSRELDKKNKLVSDLQKKIGELQRTVNEVEETAEEQLIQLTNQSKAVLQSHQEELRSSSRNLGQYKIFVKLLGHGLLQSFQQIQESSQLAKKAGVERQELILNKGAHHKACDILSLSEQDLNDLLSLDDSTASEQNSTDDAANRSKKWTKKWRRIMRKDEFGESLADHFMEIVEEHRRLMEELSTSR